MKKGFAGNIAKAFLDSKITILLMIVFMVIGVYSSFLIPREEEPQIDVPMADIFVGYPGASPSEVESRVVKPLEKIVSNVTGVKYVHSTSMRGQAMLIVQFYVGEDIERSYVKLYNELMKNMVKMPAGVTPPLVKTRSIDDVPIMNLTLWSDEVDDTQMKKVALTLKDEIETIEDISIVDDIGGRREQIDIIINPAKLDFYKLNVSQIQNLLQANHQSQFTGDLTNANQSIRLKTGQFFNSIKDIQKLIVGQNGQQPIYLHQVAEIKYAASTPQNYVSFGYGVASAQQKNYPSEYPAVSLSIAKRKGADAMQLAEQIEANIAQYKAEFIPDNIQVEVTRNYGKTASQKVSGLLLHLLGAIIAVTIIVMLAMGWRGGLVVFLSVPVTFALTLLSYYLLDYTLNRITLFALIFVTGIVVDDSIIIAENMHRHFKMKQLPFKKATIYAINEVGNPTILATLTVIASVLPMAFVSGLMGPYMSPMPIGASIAMILSLFVALTIVPYLGFIFLKKTKKTSEDEKPKDITDSKIYKFYKKIQLPLLESKAKRWGFLAIIFILLFASFILFFTNSVVVKMLPFDNKNEFQIVIDLPEGSTLEQTNAVTQEIAQYVRQRPEVVNYQSYVGTASPITFNGLVRHYDLRQNKYLSDIQVNITDKNDRSIQSHDIAKDFRAGVKAIADQFGAQIKIVEVPPESPVLSTIVAEVYGPDYQKQIQLADSIKTILNKTQDVVDIDWQVEAPQTEYDLIIDKEKAQLKGIQQTQIIQNLNILMQDQPVARLYEENANLPTSISIKLSDASKSSIDKVLNVPVVAQNGIAYPISDFVKPVKKTIEKSINRKNQRRVVYVTADMAGKLESPVYAILGMEDKLKAIDMPKGYNVNELFIGFPENTDDFTVKWDGEWQITLEVFGDLGMAFLGVIIIIYMLIVGWFQSFRAPIVMMIAIPLSLVGIILGHWILGAFFTATSFIGMIALSGIMVRNSVLLIDFVNLKQKEGMPLKEAILQSGAVRTTPILLTAGTVVIGAFVILFDPIFQGLAISLMGGSIASTVLTLIVIPLIYYIIEKNKTNN
ncbi:efflux RND transporter permease subunit [Flavobacterium sp. CS20]|uniref:efflux RND transporter permease subunit n=1 Tax=Flavobacterium sp. CS20 TaxID=2775246 RepID=UPI001B3A49A1|nr:efflux RND transporter permease subunit [Flavobacterium sp. CS20]QTY27389.1 efflux RND transporter permease subunit [Flavobacterium sp. CS20]